MNTTKEPLEALVSVLQGIQDAIEDQNKLLLDIISYPADIKDPPRLLAEVRGVVGIVKE